MSTLTLCKLLGCAKPEVVVKTVYLDNPGIDANEDIKLLSFTDAIRSLGFVFDKQGSYGLTYYSKKDMAITAFDYTGRCQLTLKKADCINIDIIEIKLPNFNNKDGYRNLKKIVEWAESIPDDIKQILRDKQK